MNKWNIGRPFRAVAAALTLSLAAACGDATDPDDHDHDEHAHADGLEVRLGATVLVEVDEQTVTGELTVQEGQHSAHLDVIFLDHDGDEITLDASEFYMRVVVADETIAEFEQDTDGEFGGHLHGEAVGTTTVTFSIMHGQFDTGHADYVSPAITVTVTAAP